MELVIPDDKISAIKSEVPSVPRSWELKRRFSYGGRSFEGRFTITPEEAGYSIGYEVFDGGWTMLNTAHLNEQEGRKLMQKCVQWGCIQSYGQN